MSHQVTGSVCTMGEKLPQDTWLNLLTPLCDKAKHLVSVIVSVFFKEKKKVRVRH